MTQALLIMDMEKGITQYFPDAVIERFAAAIAAARAAGVPVIYVAVHWRPGLPEVHPRNRYVAPLARSNVFIDGAPATDIDDRLAPRDGDVVTVKRRVGAFGGSDLDLVLRSKGIDTLVLTGIGTSGVVLSTVMAGTEMDYAMTVLSDACADSDAEVHRVLTEKVFPAHADVLTVAQWAARLA